MAENSNIEWTHHTYNPWRGCTKVSAGCKNCYAETFSKRNPAVLGIWGPNGTRPVASESYWKVPLAWDKAAAAAGERHRVFCSSLADVFEDREELHAPRLRLLELIRQTPNLDWLLLTKRPENILPALEVAWRSTTEAEDLTPTYELRVWLGTWLEGNPPANVWLGTSVEHQEAADTRIPHLLAAPATVRFLSCEPLLGPVELPLKYCNNCFKFTTTIEVNSGKDWGCAVCKTYKGSYKGPAWQPKSVTGIGWVIVGGESGPGARPMHPEWARSLRDQCQEAGVPFLFKQWGEWLPFTQGRDICKDAGRVEQTYFGARVAVNPAGGLMTATTPGITPESIYKVGKHQAGRLLDGQLHDGYPRP